MSAAENLAQVYETVGSSADPRTDWLARRRSGIGASESSIILGANGWTSILGLYYQKIDGESPVEDEHTEQQEWGIALEDSILNGLAKRAGVTLAARGPHLRSRVHRWALATPDAITTDGEPVEAKNIAWGFDDDDWTVGIPEKYFLQCQHQMMVTGAQRCLFGVLLWGARMIWEWVPRDEAVIARIVKACETFWRRVETRTEPPSDGHPEARRILSRLAVVESLVELFEPEIGDVLSEWQTAEHDLKSVRAEERATKKKRDAAADQIAQAMGKHRQAFTATGWSFRWTSSPKAGFTVEPTITNKFTIKAPK